MGDMEAGGASGAGGAGELLGYVVWALPGGDAGVGSVVAGAGAEGLAVVGVAMDEGGEEKVKGFVEELRVSYPVGMPEKMSQVEFGLEGLPATVLVDREGRVAKTYVGAVRERDFRADVEKLLKEK